MTVDTNIIAGRMGNENQAYPTSSTALTMSSLEIAGLTGKRHADVLRDARKMLGELGIQPTQFCVGYKDAKGETREAFNLPKRETLILVSGYSTEMRARIIDRWLELEAVVANASPREMVLRGLGPDVAAAITGIIHREVATLVPGMVESALVADTRAVATEFKPALAVLVERKVPPQKRRGFSQKVSSRLRKYSTANGLPMRVSRETGRYLFHVDAIAKWMAREGKALIADHLASFAESPQLKLVLPAKPS